MRKYQVQTVQTVRHVATHDVAAESFEEARDKAVAMMVSTGTTGVVTQVREVVEKEYFVTVEKTSTSYKRVKVLAENVDQARVRAMELAEAAEGIWSSEPADDRYGTCDVEQKR